jgi:hypothetical protein
LFDNRPFQRASSQQTCARTYPRIEAISHVSALLIPTHYLVLGLTRRLFLHSQSSRFFCQLALHSLGLNPKIFRIQIFRIQMEQLLCAPLSSFFFRIQIWVQTHSTKGFGGRGDFPRFFETLRHAEVYRSPRARGNQRPRGSSGRSRSTSPQTRWQSCRRPLYAASPTTSCASQRLCVAVVTRTTVLTWSSGTPAARAGSRCPGNHLRSPRWRPT